MRKINSKLFLLLLVGVLVTTGLVVGIHWLQYGRIGSALLAQAELSVKDENAKDYQRQARFLQRYLEFNPKDTAQKTKLAKLWASDAFPANSKPRKGAVALLESVLLTNPDPDLRRLLIKTTLGLQTPNYLLAKNNLEQRLPLATVLADVKEANEARAKGRSLPERLAAQNADRGELEFFWARILENDNKKTEAIGCYRLAAQHAPSLLDSSMRLAAMLRKQGNSDPKLREASHKEADAVVSAAVSANKDNAEAYLARWRYRREFDQLALRPGESSKIPLDNAANDVAEALKRAPESIDVLLAAADLERIRARVASEDPNLTPETRLDAMKAARKVARQHLDKGLELVTKQKTSASAYSEFQLLWHKCNMTLDDLDLARAQREDAGANTIDEAKERAEITQIIDRVRRSNMPIAAEYMRGRLLVNQRLWAEAAIVFERARSQMGGQTDLETQTNLYLGQCYERLQEFSQMYNAFKRVAEVEPNSTVAQLGMAMARWSQGRLDEAMKIYGGIMEGGRVPQRGYIDIARLEIQRQAASPTPDWTQCQRTLDDASKAFPNNPPELVLLRAELLIQQGKQGDALKLIQQAKNDNPKTIEYRIALIDIALRGAQPSKALSFLEEARKDFGDKPVFRTAEGRIIVATKDPKATERLIDLTKNTKGLNDDEKAQLFGAIAELLYRNDARAEARKLWQQVGELPRQKVDPRMQLLLFELALRDDDEEGMKKIIADIQTVEQSSGPNHRYAQAVYTLWQARRLNGEERKTKLDKAQTQLDAVVQIKSGWALPLIARAEIANLRGDSGQEIKDLEEAYKNGDSSTAVIRRLVVLLSATRRDNEAQALLARLQQSVLDSSGLGRLAAGVALRRGDSSTAVSLAEGAIKNSSNDPKDLVWMAGIYLGAKDPAKAEESLKQAIRLAKSDPVPRLAYLQLLMGQNRSKEAIEQLAEAEKNLGNERRTLALGRMQDTIGATDKALALYEAALKENPDAETLRTVANAHMSAGRTRLAEPLLRRIMRRELTGMSEADADWAKRGLALCLAGGTDYNRFTEALEYVGEKLDKDGKLKPPLVEDPNVENKRIRARVLASQKSQHQFRTRAIQILEDLKSAKALSKDDEFLLALLYEAEGKPEKSLNALAELSQVQGGGQPSPQFLAQYIMSLLTYRRSPDALADAEKAIVQIEKLEADREVGPNGFASVELRVRLLEAQGKSDEALALLKKHVNRKSAKADEVVLLVGGLTRQKRFDEAYDLCLKSWDKVGEKGSVSPEAAGGMSIAVLRVMKPSDDKVAVIENKLKQAIDKNPKSVVLRMHLSDLYDQRGRYDDALAVYKRVLIDEPNNVVALNNMAWLLAHRDDQANEALTKIDKAVSGLGRRADLLDTRGVVLLKLKQTTSAITDLEDAVKESPSPVRLYHLARAHAENRDLAKARDFLKQAKDKGLELSVLHPVEHAEAKKFLAEFK
jgi:tetratricopeptide (TPR) repeat protein